MSKLHPSGEVSVTADTATGTPVFSLQKLKTINLQVYVMLAAIAVIIVFFSFTTDGAYISARNISNLLRQTAITGILAALLPFLTFGLAGHCLSLLR